MDSLIYRLADSNIFEKYLAPEGDDYLFNFHERYCDSDSFSANVNNGIKKICKDMGMQKEDYYCVYTLHLTFEKGPG